jgi:hypothetical protein
MSTSSSGSNSTDRRRRERVSSETQGWLLPPVARLPKHVPDEEEAWEVRIHDLSRLGVGFTSTQSLSVGDEHRLRIGRGPMRRARLIRVVACRQTDNEVFVVGAEFVDSGTKTLARAG